jgi:uncharacterized membrane protein
LLEAVVNRAPFVLIAAAGIALSLVLEWMHVRAYSQPTADSFCAIGARVDCTSVALSRHSVFFGLPVPLLGALGFAAIGVAAWLRSRLLWLLAALGAIVSLLLLGAELFAIGALCLLCEAAHVLSFLLAVLAFRARPALRPIDREAALLVLGPVTGVAIALVLFLPRYWGAFGWKGDLPFRNGKTEDGHPWIGAESPKLTVEEITDYACPHCRVASARALRYLAANEGSLRIVRRQYPRMTCSKDLDVACQPLRVAYCAEEQGKFWQMDRWLFEHATKGTANVPAAAAAVGLDGDQLAKCVERDDIHARAEIESKFWSKARLMGTPAYRIDGKMVPMKDAEARMRAGR